MYLHFIDCVPPFQWWNSTLEVCCHLIHSQFGCQRTADMLPTCTLHERTTLLLWWPNSNRITPIRNQVVSTHDVTVLLFYHVFIPHGHRVLWVSSVCVGESYPGVSSCTLSGALSGTSTRDTQQVHICMNTYIRVHVHILIRFTRDDPVNEETPNST